MKDILVLYGSSVFTSIIYNLSIYYKVHKNTRKKVMKKLKYQEDLSKYAKRELRKINRDFAIAILIGIKKSFVPGVNAAFSINTYGRTDALGESFEAEYGHIVSRANEKEEIARITHLEILRECRELLLNMDEDIKNSLDDDSYRPSRKTFNRAVRSLLKKPENK